MNNNTRQQKVILVHGFTDTEYKMRFIKQFLEQHGFNVLTPTLTPSNGKIGIDELAWQLHEYIKLNIPENEKFDIVGFSMGGLISRYYIQKLDGHLKTEHFITISTPHKGTLTGYFLSNSGAQQMRFGSNFIRELDLNKEKLSHIKFTSIWTPLDLMIIPSNSSKLNIGLKKRIWCISHPLMVRNKECLEIIKTALMA